MLLHSPRRHAKTSQIGLLAADLERAGHLAVVRVDLEGVLTIDDIARRIQDGFRRLPGSRVGRMIRRTLDGLAVAGFSADAAGLRCQPRPAEEATPVLERLLEVPHDVVVKLDTRVLVVLDEFQALGAVPNADAILRSGRFGLSKGGVRGALMALVGRGLVHEMGGRYRLVDPLYAEWARRR